MAFRREAVLRRWLKGGAPDGLLELGAQGGDTGAEAGEGSARGTKKGRFAALREFGGSSEYREWIRGRATGDWVVSMLELWSIYMALGWMGWDDKLLACATWARCSGWVVGMGRDDGGDY